MLQLAPDHLSRDAVHGPLEILHSRGGPGGERFRFAKTLPNKDSKTGRSLWCREIGFRQRFQLHSEHCPALGFWRLLLRSDRCLNPSVLGNIKMRNTLPILTVGVLVVLLIGAIVSPVASSTAQEAEQEKASPSKVKSEEQYALEDEIQQMQVRVAMRSQEMEIEATKRDVFKSNANEKAMLEATKAKLQFAENQVKILTELFATGQASQAEMDEANLKRTAVLSEVAAVESSIVAKERELRVLDQTIQLAELRVRLAEVQLKQLERKLARLK